MITLDNMAWNIDIPNLEGNPSCSDVEPKWASVLRRGFTTPSQVVLDDLVLAELQSGNVFLGEKLLPLVGAVLVKNPYKQAPNKQFGVKNGIAKLPNGLLVVVSEMSDQEDGWQIRRLVNWDNLDQPADVPLLSSSFAGFLSPFGSKHSEI